MRNKKGTVTLEAAIAFTITLVLLASIVSAICFYRTDILMKRSVEQTCEKMALLYPVSVPSTDLMSAAVNAFPDIGVGNTKGGDIISKVLSFGIGADNATGKTLKELILQGLFSKTMEEQIRKALIEGGFQPDGRFEEMRKKATPILSEYYNIGDGWLVMAEAMDMIEQGYDKILIVHPFGCLVSHVAERGVLKKLRKLYPGANINTIEYDYDQSEALRESRILLATS